MWPIVAVRRVEVHRGAAVVVLPDVDARAPAGALRASAVRFWDEARPRAERDRRCRGRSQPLGEALRAGQEFRVVPELRAGQELLR